MNTIRHTVLLFSLLLFSSVKATTPTTGTAFWEEMSSLNTLPQEKLYLHFDKPFYAAGDRMWYRAYLVDASSHQATCKSAAVYVELINNKDSVITRQKILRRDSVFSGSILLNNDLPEGVYLIRAYTNWMRNVGDGFFYKRRFFIGNSISSQIKSTVRYVFHAKTVEAIINFRQRNTPLSEKPITYVETIKGSQGKSKKTVTDKNGAIHIEFNRSQIQNGKPLLSVLYQEKNSVYTRDFILPATNDFDVQFFAEGGNLIPGELNCIAFKSLGSDGFSTEVQGTIYEENGDSVSSFHSLHLGMGKFYLLPQSDKKYYALVKTSLGDEKRFSLPQMSMNGYSITATERKNYILINVLSQNLQATDSLLLLAQSRGKVFLRKIISAKNHTFMLNKKDLRAGIVQFLLTDKQFNPLSERLYFILPSTTNHISFFVPKDSAESRQKITTRILVNDANGQPVQGSFSLAVVDANDVKADPSADNIESNLLLSSDLKGYIEQPGSYFDPNFKDATEAIDALMLTQGWKRFDTYKELKGEKEVAPNYMEMGQEISGVVKTGLFSKATKGTKVSIISTQNKYFDVQETNSEGRFAFKGFTFPDSTTFTLQALRKKGIKDAAEFFMDTDSFPPVGKQVTGQEQLPIFMDNYLDASSEKFSFENGMRTINLKDVEVVATKAPVEVNDFEFQSNYEDFSISGKDLKPYESLPLRTLLRILPGMATWNENDIHNYETILSIDENENDSSSNLMESGPRFSIKGTIYSYTEVQGINVAELASVQVLRSYNSLGEKATYKNILIALNFKPGYSFNYSPKMNIIKITPKGYARKVEFYQPKYENEDVRKGTAHDWRSTIYWQPAVTTNEKGEAECSFWTADRNAPYRFILEGIDKSGNIYRQEESFSLFKK